MSGNNTHTTAYETATNIVKDMSNGTQLGTLAALLSKQK